MRNFSGKYQDLYGYYVWVGYTYDECVVDDKKKGTGHFEQKGPNWVQFTRGAGNNVDPGLAFGGNNGGDAKKVTVPSQNELKNFITEVERVGDGAR